MDFCALEQTTAPKNSTHVKHAIPLVICLSLLLSLLAGTGVHGQSTQRSTLNSAQPIAGDVPLASPEQLREGPVVTVRSSDPSGRARRAFRWTRSSFQIRVGRHFSITVTKH